ncbi:hypothetical protein NDU88_002636 [Pleurodeles waltl]|uniref:Uncharacterized protein n=1 Tax=Pleurodeles waltl TaxID=8319 RepID=A0AAV7MTC9_PLEWA|nr:hypothetical protein NDU88_002636 [Pleurodeles waltl]
MELQDVLGRHRPLSADTKHDQKSSHGHGRGAGEWVSAPRGGTPKPRIRRIPDPGCISRPCAPFESQCFPLFPEQAWGLWEEACCDAVERRGVPFADRGRVGDLRFGTTDPLRSVFGPCPTFSATVCPGSLISGSGSRCSPCLPP